jgi:hypothetical protein
MSTDSRVNPRRGQPTYRAKVSHRAACLLGLLGLTRGDGYRARRRSTTAKARAMSS